MTCGFQSLTGSIHTFRHRFALSLQYFVSIPHRFNSHLEKIYLLSLVSFVSIPHRFNSHDLREMGLWASWLFQSLTGSIHTREGLYVMWEVEVFQSLTGSIHTFDFDWILILIFYCFNPSQVQFTLKTKSPSQKLEASFNPSQVQFTHKKNKNIENTKTRFQSLTGSIHTKPLKPAR